MGRRQYCGIRINILRNMNNGVTLNPNARQARYDSIFPLIMPQTLLFGFAAHAHARPYLRYITAAYFIKLEPAQRQFKVGP